MVCRDIVGRTGVKSGGTGLRQGSRYDRAFPGAIWSPRQAPIGWYGIYDETRPSLTASVNTSHYRQNARRALSLFSWFLTGQIAGQNVCRLTAHQRQNVQGCQADAAVGASQGIRKNRRKKYEMHNFPFGYGRYLFAVKGGRTLIMLIIKKSKPNGMFPNCPKFEWAYHDRAGPNMAKRGCVRPVARWPARRSSELLGLIRSA